MILHPWIELQLSLEGQISLVKCPIYRKHHHHALAGSLLYVLLIPDALGYLLKQNICKPPVTSDNGRKDSLWV